MPRVPRSSALVAGAVILVSACSVPMASPPAVPSGGNPASTRATEFPFAGDFHVAPTGDDDSAGTADRPWRTLQHAADHASGTVVLAAGDYPGFRLTRSGTADRTLTFIGPADGSAVVRPGVAAPDVIHVSGVHDVELLNLTVTGAERKFAAGIRIDGGSRSVVVGQSRIADNMSFGVEVSAASQIVIRESEISGNEVGIRLIRPDGNPLSDVAEVTVADNQIHDNNRLVVNDATPNNDFGANGIILHETSGRVLIAGNTFSANRGPSRDYGTDGGAVEVWAASNVEVIGNTMFDNENIIETGTYGPDCSRITVARNVAYRTADQPRATGMILRCARDSLIAHNTLVDLDWFAFHVSDHLGDFGGSIAGLRIVNNIVHGGRSYLVDTELPESVTFDFNLLDDSVRVSSVAPTLASVDGFGPVDTLDEFREVTGQEAHGLAGQAAFVDAAAANFHLQPESLGVDAGIPLPGELYDGAAPEIGRFEVAG